MLELNHNMFVSRKMEADYVGTDLATVSFSTEKDNGALCVLGAAVSSPVFNQTVDGVVKPADVILLGIDSLKRKKRQYACWQKSCFRHLGSVMVQKFSFCLLVQRCHSLSLGNGIDDLMSQLFRAAAESDIERYDGFGCIVHVHG